MAFAKSFSLCLICLSCLLVSASEDMIVIVTAGENVVLPCQAPRNIHVSAMEWIRPDLQPEYVYLHRHERSDPENQHQSFKNRVDLKDKNMKDGDVSVTLMNVVPEDNGTYECHVYKKETTRRKRSSFDTEPIYTINLKVTESGGGAGHTEDGGDKDGGDKDGNNSGHVGLAVGLSVVAAAAAAVAVVVVVVGFVIFRKRGKKLNSNRGPTDEEDVEEPLQHVKGEELDTLRMEETRIEETRMMEVRKKEKQMETADGT